MEFVQFDLLRIKTKKHKNRKKAQNWRDESPAFIPVY